MKDQLVTKKILKWYDLNKRSLPWRKNVSNQKRQYYTLVSEFMLQQTQVATVIPYFNRFIKDIPNLTSLAKVQNKKLIKLWEGLGYYSRVRNLKKTAQLVIKNFKGKLPNNFEDLVINISSKIQSGKTIIDVCSVKVFPKQVMIDNLPAETDIIATHPLFGPDSLKDSGSVMTMEAVRDSSERYNFWKNYFESQNITIEEISAEEHDMMAARSQGLTHFVGRIIDDFGTNQTRIDTEGYKALHKLVSQTCNDTWDLFEDIQNYNPYTEKMISELNGSFKKISEIIEK